jgi:hypothetical protein
VSHIRFSLTSAILYRPYLTSFFITILFIFLFFLFFFVDILHTNCDIHTIYLAIMHMNLCLFSIFPIFKVYHCIMLYFWILANSYRVDISEIGENLFDMCFIKIWGEIFDCYRSKLHTVLRGGWVWGVRRWRAWWRYSWHRLKLL